jgi:hypothetical protein
MRRQQGAKKRLVLGSSHLAKFDRLQRSERCA